MIGPPARTRIWLAAGFTDLRRGFDGLAALVQTRLEADPFSGHAFVFRGRRGDRIKISGSGSKPNVINWRSWFFRGMGDGRDCA